MSTKDDTIVAVATPPGEGAIAVVRLSGPGSVGVAAAVFRGRTELSEAAGYTAHFGNLVDERGETVDEVIATVFRAPHSYTGEDAVEISCHGGMLVTARVLRLLTGAGARQAEPGEFTRRAFLNGRIDLSQAEAVADLIRARSERARVVSLQQLSGRLGARVGGLRSELVSLCALLEIELDFSEEGIDLVSAAEVRGRIAGVRDAVRGMVATFQEGKIVREGVGVVLTGKPNAGKSSLFNALLQEERAIVTPLPGTTRDYLEEGMNLGGLLFRLHDTAGLREAEDAAEAAGIERSRQVVERSDIVVEVVDATDEEGWPVALRSAGEAERILALNKIDLVHEQRRGELVVAAGRRGNVVLLSARTGEGVQHLKELLLRVAVGVGGGEEGVVITNERHVQALGRAERSLMQALTSLRDGATGEYIAFDLREAANALAEITGEITREEILNHIFSRFCIGK